VARACLQNYGRARYGRWRHEKLAGRTVRAGCRAASDAYLAQLLLQLVAARYLIDLPGRWEAAGCHGDDPRRFGSVGPQLAAFSCREADELERCCW
jgi:hypothetical protein